MGDESSQSPEPAIKAPQNNALAGVGSPMKPIACRSSRLNFASRSAEKAAMIKAAYAR